MVYFQSFLLDLLHNLFQFFTMELFCLTFFRYTHSYQKTAYRYLFLFLFILISTQPTIPYINGISIILCFLYLCLVSSFHIKDSVFFCIKYELIINFLQIFAGLFCAFINYNMYGENQNLSNLFFDYQSLTGIMFAYILLNLYLNTRHLKSLHIKTVYPTTFSVLSTGTIFLLLFFNSMLSKYTEIINLLPWLYVSVIGILILSLNSYRKIIEILDDEMKQKLLVDKYEMELSHFHNIEEVLTTISGLRHDMKNHLIVLDSYAEQNRIDELRNYIKKIDDTLTGTKLICTRNPLISSILNVKNTVCQKLHIAFQINCDDIDIHISDFAIITILGNLLDNAITAAAKTEQGYISFSLLQADGYLEIACLNNYCGDILEKNGVFTSTKKEEQGLHGLGIGNMRNCVEALRGTMDIDYHADTFSVTILFPNFPCD